MRAPSSFATRIEPELTGNGIEVLRARNLRKDDRGQITSAVSRRRKLGLGVAGFANALIDLDIAYDEEAAIKCSEGVTLCRACGFSSTS